MASNNTGYPYQRPQHPNLQGQNTGQTFPQQQGQVGSYGNQRWTDYNAIARNQQHHHQQHEQISNLAMGNVGGSLSRTSGARGIPASSASGIAGTATSSPTQNTRQDSETSFAGYGQYIATHVQHYQAQTQTSTADIPHDRARTVTTNIGGYNTYPVQNYPPATSVETTHQYRTSTAPRQQVQQYFDYQTTSAQGYPSLYQTSENSRQQTATAQSYAPGYQTAETAREASSMYQPDPRNDTREVTVYQPADTPHQYQPPQRTVTPSTQFQAVNQPQYPASTTPVQQYTAPTTPQQYDTFPQRTTTPHTVTSAPESSYTTTSYATQTQPQAQITNTPSTQKAKSKPKPKPKPKPKTQDGAGLAIKSWKGPAAPPPLPKAVPYEGYYTQEQWSGADAQDMQRGLSAGGQIVAPQGGVGGMGGAQQRSEQSWLQEVKTSQNMQMSSVQNVVPSQPQGSVPPENHQQQQQQQGHSEQSWPPQAHRPTEQQMAQTQTQAQTQARAAHQPQPQPTQVHPTDQQQTQLQGQVRYTGQHTVHPAQLQAQPVAQARPQQSTSQYQQSNLYPEPEKPRQREPEPQYSPQQPVPPQHEPQPQYQPPTQHQPPPQPAPQRDSPQPRAPSEPRPAPPLDKGLMEQQMKIMVERMRYYQSTDPATFQQVWETVRKSTLPTITAGGSANTSREEQKGRRVIMGRDGGAARAEEEGARTSSGEEAKMETVFTHSQTPDAGGNQTGTQSQQVEVQALQTQHQPSTNVPAPAQTSVQPLRVSNPPQASISSTLPSHHDVQIIKTAKAVSKYLIKISGHCPTEEKTMSLLSSIKSFPILCDKLEEMGYKFHRGNFSRFLLAEVDGNEEEAPKEAVDDGGSRVLGEVVEDDQEQIMREVNEAKSAAPKVKQATPTAHPEAIETAVSVAPPALDPSSLKRGRGRPRKSDTPRNTSLELQASDNATPKTPTVSITLPAAFPTPMSIAPTVPMAGNPTALLFGQQPPLSNNPPPNPADYIPRHPTPQSVKAAHAGPPNDSAAEVKQFVSPSLVYRPPTPPQMVVDIDSSPSPPPPETYSPLPPVTVTSPPPLSHAQLLGPLPERLSDVEMVDVETTPMGQRQGGEVGSLQGTEDDSDRAPVPPPPLQLPQPRPQPMQQPTKVNTAVTIDLTSSATPEPQINRAPPIPPASAPQFDKERQLMHPKMKIIPSQFTAPLMAPNSAPAKSNAAPPLEPRLYELIQPEKALKKLQYDPATIARDILIASGRNSDSVRPLNAHLNILRRTIGLLGLVTSNADLETVRWDILDPDPIEVVSFGDYETHSDGGYGGMADDEGSGGVEAVVARAPVINNPVMKAIEQAVTPSPTPAARGRHAVRGGRRSILGASIASFEALGQGITTALNGTNSTSLSNDSSARTPQRQAAPTNGSRSSGNGNGNYGNTGGGAWGGFAAPTPRSAGSGLRNVVTPDMGTSNFAVVIRSPSVSSIDRNRAEPSSARGVKRKLDGSEKEKGTPAKKPTKPVKQKGESASKVPRNNQPEVDEEDEDEDELKPSGFKVFKCKWRFCPAELHNFETLHRHVVKVHCKLASYGGYQCNWEGCSRSPTKEMKKAAAAKKGPPVMHVWDFDTPEKWEKHVVDVHLESIKNEIGVGPSVGPYDREAFGSDVDYLSDNQGRQVTPLARPAPPGYVFLPPPGFQWQGSTQNRSLVRVRTLGAGMEGDEAADLREFDDGQGVFADVRMIVAAEDVSVASVLGSGSNTSKGAKEKQKNGKGKDKEAGGSDVAVPLGIGAFTVYEDE